MNQPPGPPMIRARSRRVEAVHPPAGRLRRSGAGRSPAAARAAGGSTGPAGGRAAAPSGACLRRGARGRSRCLTARKAWRVVPPRMDSRAECRQQHSTTGTRRCRSGFPPILGPGADHGNPTSRSRPIRAAIVAATARGGPAWPRFPGADSRTTPSVRHRPVSRAGAALPAAPARTGRRAAPPRARGPLRGRHRAGPARPPLAS